MSIKSSRRKDIEGRLRVDNCAFTKATVNQYLGREIPNGTELGVDPDKIYNVYRPLDELEAAIPTFEGVQIMEFHTTVDADGVNGPKRLQTVGNLTSVPRVDGDKLRANMIFFDHQAIKDIETDERSELSASYIFDGVLEAGTFEGLPYDIKMTNIQANHVALVKSGRAGPDVRVSDSLIRANDSMPIDQLDANALKGFKMKTNAFNHFVNQTLSKLRAGDSAELTVGDLEVMLKETAEAESEGKIDPGITIVVEPENIQEVLEKVVGDEDLPESITSMKDSLSEDQYAAVCAAFRAATAKAEDEEMSDEDKKKAADEAEAAKKEKEKAAEDKKRAGDAATREIEERIRKDITEFNTACEDVKQVVVIKRAQDSSYNAADVYKSALVEMKIGHDGIDGVAGLRTLFNASKGAAPRAEDSKTDAGSGILDGIIEKSALKLDTFDAKRGAPTRAADSAPNKAHEPSSFLKGIKLK